MAPRKNAQHPTQKSASSRAGPAPSQQRSETRPSRSPAGGNGTQSNKPQASPALDRSRSNTRASSAGGHAPATQPSSNRGATSTNRASIGAGAKTGKGASGAPSGNTNSSNGRPPNLQNGHGQTPTRSQAATKSSATQKPSTTVGTGASAKSPSSRSGVQGSNPSPSTPDRRGSTPFPPSTSGSAHRVQRNSHGSKSTNQSLNIDRAQGGNGSRGGDARPQKSQHQVATGRSHIASQSQSQSRSKSAHSVPLAKPAQKPAANHSKAADVPSKSQATKASSVAWNGPHRPGPDAASGRANGSPPTLNYGVSISVTPSASASAQHAQTSRGQGPKSTSHFSTLGTIWHSLGSLVQGGKSGIDASPTQEKGFWQGLSRWLYPAGGEAQSPTLQKANAHISAMKVVTKSSTDSKGSSKSSSSPTPRRKESRPVGRSKMTYSASVKKRRMQMQAVTSKGHSSHQKAVVRGDGVASPVPRYQRDLVWRKSSSPRITSAYSTETAAPLPSPPRHELKNKVALDTIAKHPHLFKISTPIKVDVFKKYLKKHPNQPYVKSVCRGLREGFWPWADTRDHPVTYDNSGRLVRSGAVSNFIKRQRDEEMKLKRWSKPFGTKLLPGMYSSPIGAVPKRKPGTYRLIVNQSRGRHALNSMIPQSHVKVTLDDIHDLGTKLLAVRKKHGTKRKLCLFKSDVKSAYRLMPMHPLWQIRQVVNVDGKHHVDRCNTFGSRASGWIFGSFMNLVLWIGTEVKGLPDLLGYVDDDFSWEFEDKKTYYKPYKKFLPTKQAKYLQLWDELGIPHEEEKQCFGPSLPIIGYDVDPNAMKVKLPDDRKASMIQMIRNVAHEGRQFTLRQLQSFAGSANYALTLYPHLRPRLHALFQRMAGNVDAHAKITITRPVAHELLRLAEGLEHAQPIPIQTSDEGTKEQSATAAGSSRRLLTG